MLPLEVHLKQPSVYFCMLNKFVSSSLLLKVLEIMIYSDLSASLWWIIQEELPHSKQKSL